MRINYIKQNADASFVMLSLLLRLFLYNQKLHIEYFQNSTVTFISPDKD